MFRHIIFWSAILISLAASGQNLTRLDANNGFRKFKFGMSPTQFSNLEISTSTDLKFRGVIEYKYKGNDIKNFYGVKIDEISLSFYKNKLYQIMVSFGTIDRKYSDNEYTLVDDALRGCFWYKHP